MEYISYNMGTWDFPDKYARALEPAALGLGHIYQANPSCPCYNHYVYAKCIIASYVCIACIFYSALHVLDTGGQTVRYVYLVTMKNHNIAS